MEFEMNIRQSKKNCKQRIENVQNRLDHVINRQSVWVRSRDIRLIRERESLINATMSIADLRAIFISRILLYVLWPAFTWQISNKLFWFKFWKLRWLEELFFGYAQVFISTVIMELYEWLHRAFHAFSENLSLSLCSFHAFQLLLHQIYDFHS